MKYRDSSITDGGKVQGDSMGVAILVMVQMELFGQTLDYGAVRSNFTVQNFCFMARVAMMRSRTLSGAIYPS